MRFGLLPMEGGYTPPGTQDFQWGSLWPGVLPDWFNKPLAQAIIAALLVIILWWWASRNLKVQPGKGQALADDERTTRTIDRFLTELESSGAAR